LETEFRMTDVTAVRRAVDRLLSGAPGPLLDLLAEDVAFEVTGGGDMTSLKDRGRRPVMDYFTALGGLEASWQIDYTRKGRQVIAWGKGECEFALLFDLSDGMITRFQVIDDLSLFVRRGASPRLHEPGTVMRRGSPHSPPAWCHNRRARPGARAVGQVTPAQSL
jgi:hypothetical protein